MPCCSANLFPCGYHRGKLKSVDIFSQIWMEYEVWTYRSMLLLESKIIANNKVLEVQASKSSEAWFELTLSELLSLHWFERGEFSSLNSAEDSEVPDFVHRRWFLLPIITFVVTEPRKNGGKRALSFTSGWRCIRCMAALKTPLGSFQNLQAINTPSQPTESDVLIHCNCLNGEGE